MKSIIIQIAHNGGWNTYFMSLANGPCTNASHQVNTSIKMKSIIIQIAHNGAENTYFMSLAKGPCTNDES